MKLIAQWMVHDENDREADAAYPFPDIERTRL